MLRLDDLEVLVQAAELGSLSAAAREMDITPAVASLAIKRLEAELKLRLLVRSTRSLRLTAEGAHYLVHAKTALNALRAGEAELNQQRQRIAGELTISMPSDVGRNLLLGWFDDFVADHPELRLRLRISDRLSDFYRQPVDLALRYGVPEDSSLVALPLLTDNHRLLCAAPAYLERHGAPATPADLSQHNCLRFVLGDRLHDRWRFGDQTVQVNGDRSSDDADCVRRWAVNGHGIAYKSALDIQADLAAGRLRALLPDWPTEATPLYLVCAHRLSLTPAVTALRSYLQQRLERYRAGKSALQP
ncbi:LysR family transcriptional regulator [Saccharospirillum mangrovi]|uniref:LysR family transcriptional regulator n=1 Tax=Saccharospirillum mangrovi TaxID=2161747 RepID=UPI000D36BF67|nr:LysR family transcriptional regulator [Saccharospirillum mangrovi]